MEKFPGWNSEGIYIMIEMYTTSLHLLYFSKVVNFQLSVPV